MRKNPVIFGLLVFAGCCLLCAGYVLMTWHVRRVVAAMLRDLGPFFEVPS